jgi:hypothetical protein
MKEIKSVRVRKTNVKSGTLDIKVSLYENKRTFAADEMVLVGTNNGNIVWQEARYKIKNTTEPIFFISNFIATNNNLGSTDKNSYYDIIQDPWEETAPIIRNYGYDPYYLNNGAEVYISWTDVDSKISEGGEKYSKPDGTEITYDPTFYKETGNVKSLNITKSIRIDHKEETQYLTLNKNNEFEYTIYSNDYRATDLIVLDILIGEWKRKIPNYDLALCSPNNESCSIIPYKSPMKPIEPEPVPAEVVATNETPKEPIMVVLPESIKVKIDTTFKIFIGKNKELIETQTVLQDDELTDLSDEYTEENFAGAEEQVLQLTGVDDEPVGPSFDEELAKEEGIENTPRGNPPIRGSKLTNKSGSSMINLAGHRLTPILKDLENYLNKNGYPGTKIGNNGVMRDLRGSAYPSSPARATASLHGVGLAIDVTFKIPGFKWSGIGDNKNLASDSKLTQTIDRFFKGQGDLFWGAGMGGSNPSSGSVIKRGVTEYHHIEIKSDLIPGYWEPVKDELAKFGFKPSELKSPGKGSALHKLMLKLLGDTA